MCKLRLREHSFRKVRADAFDLLHRETKSVPIEQLQPENSECLMSASVKSQPTNLQPMNLQDAK